MGNHYIKFENVTKSYGSGAAQINALSEASFEINKGEFCALLGSSGAGKTTLLNMLGGMDTVTSGKIYFDGRDIASLSKKELVGYRRHDVGFVFQFYNLIPNLTSLENVEIAAQSFARTRSPQGRRLQWSGSPTERITFPPSFREASSREWQLRAPWRKTL